MAGSVPWFVPVLVAVASIVITTYYNQQLPQQQHTGEARTISEDASCVQPSVIIVGGGLAGMSAAVEAYNMGATVLLLDKEGKLGGNSAKASSGINGANTSYQKAINSTDTVEALIDDTLSSGHGLCVKELVEVLARNSASAVDFVSSFGLELNALSKCGGHSHARTHRASTTTDGRARNVGFEITRALAIFLEALPRGRMEIRTSSLVTDIVLDKSGRAVGVRYKDTKDAQGGFDRVITASADSIILTSGGYGRDKDGLLQEFAPSVKELPTTNGPWALGEGVKMARRIGASLTLMDKVQVHPTGIVDPKDPLNPTKFLAPEALRGCGGLLLNQKGERFVNELGLRDHVTGEIFEHCDHYKLEDNTDDTVVGPITSYLILNTDAVTAFNPAYLSFYMMKGFIQKYDNAQQFAEENGIDVATVEETLRQYTNAASGATEDSYGKTTFPTSYTKDDALHMLRITPSIHYTMGGVVIDTSARVLRDAPIPGLYAAGEVTGGVHGGNRLAGNSLLECAVFGRVAGGTAVKEAQAFLTAGKAEPLSICPLPYVKAFEELSAALGDRFSVKPGTRTTYSKDMSYHPQRVPDAVVFPVSTEEVSTVMKIANKYDVVVVPYGVGSSLEGQVSAVNGGITISFEYMQDVLEVNDDDMYAIVQPGIRRKQLNTYLESHKLFLPNDPGADASIGGMASTRASGTTAVGYGTMRENTLSLVIVTPQGDIVRTASYARKTAAGYDLTHLIVGSEGTLGVITELAVKLYPLPKAVSAGVCSFESVEAAATTVMKTMQNAISVQRMELLNAEAIDAVNKKFPDTINLPLRPHLFLEVHGSTATEVSDRMSQVQAIAEAENAIGFEQTTNQTKRDELWQARHGAYFAASRYRPECGRRCKLFVTDVCVPVSHLAECIVGTETDFASSTLPMPIVGHVGDGNFHLMVPVDVTNPAEVEEMNLLNDRLVKRALALNGTCTGEHGVGLGKRKSVVLEHGEVGVDIMRKIKKALDPHSIMNPHKIFTLHAGDPLLDE
eukprot:TRINITY_DN4682_c0_g1_i1.p1 TRINITY_DN4682_c0_g1~~TRINITY_DN4682_c0_g1_i1.p1  ORF type:complete len:1018 (-),score=257.47 TRINITY_DN4682_c0_g1_i1:32-3085(-)